MPSLKLTVLGQPVPKARPRVVRLKTGKSLTYTPDATVAQMDLIRWAFKQSGQAGFSKGALIMICKFYLVRPKSVKRKDPVVKPDLINYVQLVSDALTGFAYTDDAQIVRLVADKFYADGPRTEIEIHRGS